MFRLHFIFITFYLEILVYYYLKTDKCICSIVLDMSVYCHNRYEYCWQVPVQRVTRYPLLLSRLVKVTPGGHSDKEALQEAQEKVATEEGENCRKINNICQVEAGLDTMNQETSRDTGTTKLWRRISMINTPYRRSEHQIDLLGSTTWGVRKVNSG